MMSTETATNATTRSLRDKATSAREALDRALRELQIAHDAMCAFSKEIQSHVPCVERLKHARVDGSLAYDEVNRIIRMIEK